VKDKKSTAFVVFAVALALAVAFGGWYLEREFNFRYGYDAKVKDTVKEMVKPECLKGPP